MYLSDTQIRDFRAVVLDYYTQHGRHDLPWRQPEADGSFDPYKILVSELMLQQTQVSRVIPKYEQFLELFPTVQDVATSSLAAILTAWSGLGYNRRAKYLHLAAKQIVHDFGGELPHDVDELIKLPGVGPNTAGAIAAYAFNQPVTFVETNIRTVYIYHFFHDQSDVPDSAILKLLIQTLPGAEGKRAAPVRLAESEFSSEGAMRKVGVPAKPVSRGKSIAVLSHYRSWYWALMDYGAFLKQSVGNLNKLSKHYTVQSGFKGSKRQIRGQVIRNLAIQSQSEVQLAKILNDARLPAVLADLLREGMITQKGAIYSLTA